MKTKISDLLEKITDVCVWLHKIEENEANDNGTWCTLKPDGDYAPIEYEGPPSVEERSSGKVIVCLLGEDGKFFPRAELRQKQTQLSKYIADLEFLENYGDHYQGKRPQFTFPVRMVHKELTINTQYGNVFKAPLDLVSKIYAKGYWTELNEYYLAIDGEKISEQSMVMSLETNFSTVDPWVLTERQKILEKYGLNPRHLVDFSSRTVEFVFEHRVTGEVTLIVEGYEILNMTNHDGEYSWEKITNGD